MVESKPANKTMIARVRSRSASIGVYGVGHHVYWDQFEGLRDELLGYMREFVALIDEPDIEVTNFGLVDEAKSAYSVAKAIRSSDIDLLFVDMLTYATSATFAVVIREISVPIVLVALQPAKALSYETCSTYTQLCNDNICSLPEFVGTAVRFGKKPPRSVIGWLHSDERAEQELKRYIDVAKVLHCLQSARIGHFGHPLESMYDMHVDQAALTRTFGCHIVQAEIDDLESQLAQVTEAQVDALRERILEMFDTPDPEHDPVTEKLTEGDLTYSARVAAALERFVSEHELDGLAYFHRGSPGSERERLASNLIVGNSLLTAAGTPICGESDIKTNIAMLIMDQLGVGGSFAEFHPVDFNSDTILVGHDGPHHINVAEGRPVLRSLSVFHGKPGSGASIEFKLKVGPITMLGINSDADGQFRFIVAEGESRDGRIPPTGNTNTRGYFYRDSRDFLNDWLSAGPTHHFALGIGHIAESLEVLGEFLGIDVIVVSRAKDYVT